MYKGISFIEGPWMRNYIQLNMKLRTKATDDFEKDFSKLMNNSVFGKCIENIRNCVDVKLVIGRKKASRPNLQRCTIFDENLVVIHMKRTKLVFDKPVSCGVSILDISKTLMYDFH